PDHMTPCASVLCSFFFPLRPPPRPTLFPYTTLFRSFSPRVGLTWRGPSGHELFGSVSRGFRAPALVEIGCADPAAACPLPISTRDRKSTRLNSSHVSISYAVFCLKKKNKELSDPEAP